MKVFAILLLLSSPAFAVYPPSTMLEDQNSVPKSAQVDPATIQQFNETTDKLKERERALDDVVKDLQRDEQRLKASAESMERRDPIHDSHK